MSSALDPDLTLITLSQWNDQKLRRIADNGGGECAAPRTPQCAPGRRRHEMLPIFILLYVSSANSLCDGTCFCNYKHADQDYMGETVDCSHRNVDAKVNLTLPKTIYSLDLSYNNITSIDSSIIFDSSTMVELYLNRNHIVNLNCSLALPSLKKLDLSDNSISKIDGHVFDKLKNLEYLNLANNKFTSLDKLTFHRLTNLKEIVLDNNDIGEELRRVNLFDRSGLGLTAKIRSLSIRGVKLNRVPDNFFVDAYDIRKLVISNNNITDVFEFPFTLEYLDISDNPIEIISSEDFADLAGLKVLKLNNLKITEISGYMFEPLHSLTSLELERNMNLTKFDAFAFGKEVLEDADYFNLEELSVRGSRLTTLDKRLMEPFGRLIKLDLQGNAWSCDCKLYWIKQLQIPEEYRDHVRCFTPKSLHNARALELDAKYFSCKIGKGRVGGVVAVVTFCVILAIIALWIFIYLPRSQSRGNAIRQIHVSTATYSILPGTMPIGTIPMHDFGSR
ncbi:TLR4 interactor with leucine rich repeats [Bombyx mori]|uniref:LRRCT domain-containing protein n=1 Tax=Bombyx mori TaxID=7091 RepID=A0A8R1WKF1_BOMMO|nr:TLR4 interactor with leucine rich repeats [Bombyx mori]